MTEKTSTKNAASESGAPRSKLVDHVEVICEALLGSGTLTIGRLNTLTKGDIVTLDRSPADPVDIRINGKTVARGEIVTLDEKFAIRLTEIG